MRVIWNHFYPKKDSDYPPIVQEIDFSWPLWPRSGIRSVENNQSATYKHESSELCKDSIGQSGLRADEYL